EDAGLLLVRLLARDEVEGGDAAAVLVHRGALLVRRDLVHQRVPRREDHEGRAEDRVRPRGENADHGALGVELRRLVTVRGNAAPRDREGALGALAPADPVLLGAL